MKTTSRHQRSPGLMPSGELAELRDHRTTAAALLDARRKGAADTAAGSGASVVQSGPEHAGRQLIEAMSEGAVTLSEATAILYANPCFAQMVQCPLELAASGSFTRFLSPADAARFRIQLKTDAAAGIKMAAMLCVSDGSLLPVQISARTMADDESGGLKIGVVVTDLTVVRRAEGLLRALTNRVVQSQEDERGRVALELHDNITQLLCALLFRSEALAERLSERGGAPEAEAQKIRDMLSQTAKEVERISHNLRSSVINELGLIPVLRDASREFDLKTGVAVELDLAPFAPRLPAETELALYRILQQTLANVEAHAQAHHVTVALKARDTFVQLKVEDDGRGFDLTRHEPGPDTGFGLLGMRERAAFLGGTFDVKSVRRRGTIVEVNVPRVAAARRSGRVG